MIISRAATLGIDGEKHEIMINDVSRAYFYAKCTRDLYVELPVEDPEADFIGKAAYLKALRHLPVAVQAVLALEPQIREFCARALDPLVGTDRFDFAADLGAEMPMRVIGMLLGIPDADQPAIRDRSCCGDSATPSTPTRSAT